LEWLVRFVGNTCIRGKVFATKKPGWSPMQELVSAAVAFSQSRGVTDYSHHATPYQNIILHWYLVVL